MRTYYTQNHAQHYNRTWKSFSEKTLAATLSLVDIPRLRQEASEWERPLRILDAACGTGLLLAQLAAQIPQAELYGIDGSEAMLTQAATALQNYPRVHLTQAMLGDGSMADLPYTPAFFDLILCTNALHYFPNPVATLRGLRQLLAPTSQMIVEDYELRGFPFPWKALEWAIKTYDPQHRRLYTIAAARTMCQHASLQVVRTHTFQIDLFCQGWALLLRPQEN